jgi:hypothetical protein
MTIAVLLLGSMYAPVAWAGPGQTHHLSSTHAPITSGGGSPPQFTSDDHTTFIVNQFNSFDVTTTTDTPETIDMVDSLPSGVNFVDNDDGTGTLSGTPDSGSGGIYPLTIHACNSGGCTDQSFTLTVEEAPAITSADNITFTVGQFDSFQVTTTGSPPPTLNWQNSLPSGMSFVDNSDGTATLSGTPDVGTFGIYSSTIEACNDVTCTDQSFTLTIQEAPSFTSSDSATFTVGVPGTFTVTTTGTTPISLSVFSGSFPADVQFVDNEDGTATISGTPQAGTDGPYLLSFQACNSVDCTTSSFTLTVNPAGPPPPPPSCTTPPTGMIAWYPGDGNANDLIGVNDGTLEGGATFVSGEVGQAFSFNGTNQDVSIGDPANLKVTTGITIDAWINPSSGPSAGLGGIVTKWHQDASLSSTADSYAIWLSNTAPLSVFTSIHTTDGGEPQFSGGVIPLNTWSHVAMTYDAATGFYALYVNGVLVNSTTTNAGLNIFATDAPIYIGSEAAGAGRFFPGLIDEVEVFNRALSASEIQSIYNAGSAGKCKCEIPLKPGGSLSSPNSGINDGYDTGRGTVFQANEALSVAGAGLWTSPIGNLTMTVNLWETTTYPGNVDNTLLATGTRTMQAQGFAFYDVGFNTPVVLQVGHNYHIEVLYDNAAVQNFYYSFDQGDVSLGAIDVLDGTQGGNTANELMPLIRLLTCDAPPAELQLLNISGRASVGTGDNVAIDGFIIQDDPASVAGSHTNSVSGPTKQVLIRGIGPSLAAFGVANPLQDPVLELYDHNGTIIASNDDWRVPSQNETDVTATGLAPSDDHESAMVVSLNTNAAYTAILQGKNNTTGVGLVEVYDLDKNGAAHLTNLSTRAFVSTGDDVLIGGIIIGDGNTAQVLFRAIGPSLANFNVNSPLQDPELDLYDGQGNHVAHNDNWKEEPDGTANPSREAAINATGLAPSNDKEAAILFVPAPGGYTAIVSGVGGTTGVGLVEAYRLQN